MGDEQAVVLRMGASRFAVTLDAVAEVGPLLAATRVPGAPAWLVGVANWRGRLLPVLDLRPLLGTELAPLGPAARTVVVCHAGLTVGLAVDAVEGTGDLRPQVDELPATLVGAELLAGQVPREDGPIAVLDPAAVLRLREQLPRVRRTA